MYVEVRFDIQDVINRQNLRGQYFDAQIGEIKKRYQSSLLLALRCKLNPETVNKKLNLVRNRS